jgi:hypothetical protein
MIKLTTFKEWWLTDYSKIDDYNNKVTPDCKLPPGCHIVERVLNNNNHPCLVLKGTKFGALEDSWKDLATSCCPENRVIIEETEDIFIQRSPEEDFAITGRFLVTFKH